MFYYYAFQSPNKTVPQFMIFLRFAVEVKQLIKGDIRSEIA